MTTLEMPRFQSLLLRSDPDMLLAALRNASTKQDVRSLLDKHGHEPVSAAWTSLDPIEKAALNLVRVFNGTLLHDDGSEPNAVRNE